MPKRAQCRPHPPDRALAHELDRFRRRFWGHNCAFINSERLSPNVCFSPLKPAYELTTMAQELVVRTSQLS